eukprot:TRINITY_DN12417_c0_g1_i3.p1 TRINITY_DN12417_c0_g1~~TRINITY_DN12417_c0_g1_i3.p1  ORF type:complete len:261 (+),score=72.08 TRINITY_DN12417_c0_g1_i3:108-890(+)
MFFRVGMLRKGLCAVGAVGAATYWGPSVLARGRPGHDEPYKPGQPVNEENTVCSLEFMIDGNAAGTVVVELYDDTVPFTARNFRILCSGKYVEWTEMQHLHPPGQETFLGSLWPWKKVFPYTYDVSNVHRIIPGFMLQAGDFTNGNGTGGRSVYLRSNFNDESFKGKAGEHKIGSLSMANSGPNTNGSQFFITFDKTEWLDGRHVVFGQVLEGYDVVRRIEACGTRSGRPTHNVMLKKATLVRPPSGSLQHLIRDEPSYV